MFVFVAAAIAYPQAITSPQAQLVLGEARATTLDLYRAYPGSDKILVPVGLPDGSEELFIVDTGAATSVISGEVAGRLHLDPASEAGLLMGLGGAVPWIRTSVPQVRLGAFQLNAVDMAIDVLGVPTSLGALPVGGILGNNVWSNFVTVIDYPADRMELYLEGEYRVPAGAAPMRFNGRSIETEVRITAGTGRNRATATVPLEIDTGAHDILLLRENGEPFRRLTSTGEEPILGIGADLDRLPDHMLLQATRRIRVNHLDAGGRRVKVHDEARWLCADGGCPEGELMPGLLGYQALAEWRATFDFPGQSFHLGRTRGPTRSFDATAAWLAHEQAVGDPGRAAVRARLAWASDRREVARLEVAAGLDARPGDPELTVFSAWMKRASQDWEGAITTLASLGPAALAEQGEWVAYIGSIILQDRPGEALERARGALGTDPLHPEHREDFLVALSDAYLVNGRVAEAGAALDEATEASPKGASAHLLRRARIAQAGGDRRGAIGALRELMENVPLQGLPFWLYGTLAHGPDVPAYTTDVERALARLHPGSEPWDFVGAGFMAVGAADRAAQAFDAGFRRDCLPLPAGAPKGNCEAWYWALANREVESAQFRIEAALAAEPDNSSYLDTAAVVALAAGRPQDALTHALHAARLHPDDPYLAWQLNRIRSRLLASR